MLAGGSTAARKGRKSALANVVLLKPRRARLSRVPVPAAVLARPGAGKRVGSSELRQAFNFVKVPPARRYMQ